MKDCLFCKIIKGDIPSFKIYEDDNLFVFMDINPVSNGHLLVIPKEHVVTVLDINNSLINNALNVIQNSLYPLLKEKLNIDGLTITQNNFLGQDVKHYHIHLIPKYNKDNPLKEKKEVEEIFNLLNN
ncbi:MAG: HIT domain-containing protein [Bacilli bacterium]|nr:HIT domain-containing protein [Bacilli bacterium]